MKKFILGNISIICVICLIACMAGGFAFAAGVGASGVYEPVSMYFNGIKIADGIKVEDTTYIPLRTFFDVIGDQTDIAWDKKSNTVTVSGEGLEMSATAGSLYMTANNRCFYLPGSVLVIDGALCLPIRELAKIYQLEVDWDEELSSVILWADDPAPLESGDLYYSAEDLYWLSRLINAESGNQSLDGKIGVGNVVLNRVADPTCPDSIYSVIFDNRYGVQFSVTETGGIYAEPNEESVAAAKMCLEGYDIVGNAIYFVNPELGISSWFTQTRTFVAAIGDHNFYA